MQLDELDLALVVLMGPVGHEHQLHHGVGAVLHQGLEGLDIVVLILESRD